MTTAIDPTRVEHQGVLLSEFVGNHSVYYHGYPNPVQSDVWTRGSMVGRNWVGLGDMLAEITELVALQGGSCKAFSISYGWIHPRLSEKIVRWKNPSDPSYHRWDMGAACDINFHAITFAPYQMDLIFPNHNETFSPLSIAATVNARPPHALDRTITYSESPYICFGTATGPGLAKWYENRFEGARNVKPRFLTHRGGGRGRGTAASRPQPLEVDWRGGGWPSHHGGGKCQYHHIRTSLYTVMSDWLYDRDRVHYGTANRMPMSTRRYERLKQAMHFAGAVFDVIQATCAHHVPIIEGLKMEPRTSNWEESGHWSFTVAAPAAEGEQFYRQLVEEVLPAYREPLRITMITLAPPQRYLTSEGRPLGSATQTRIHIEGEYDGHDRFDFDTAARSPEFCDGPERGSNGGDSGSEGVVNPPRRIRRGGSYGNSRRGIRTRTFRGGD